MKRLILVVAAASTVAMALAAGTVLSGKEEPAGDAGANDGFKPLFNGKNLDGWTTKGNWFVKDGVLHIEPRPGEKGWKRYDAYLWADKPYANFVLDLEFQLPPKGNSGVFVRVKDKADPVKTGIEVQINDTHGKEKVGPHDCGGVIGIVGPTKNMAKPAGQWNRMVITCRGSRLKVSLNGEEIVDTDLAESAPKKEVPPSGWLSLQDHGLPLAFRNIRLKVLD